MPAPSVKDAFPPQDLLDREEGWGILGRVVGYPYKDTGVWPVEPGTLLPSKQLFNEDDPLEQPETSDGNWYRNGELI